MHIDSNLNFSTTSQNIKEDLILASLLKDDPWALLRQCIGQGGDEIDFDREQPLISELPEREPF